MNNKLIFGKNTTFDDAINMLDLNGNGVLPVVDSFNMLTGIITDGDIRKAILNKRLDLEHIINKNPYKLNINSSRSQIISYLKKVHRRHLPLVDDDNQFIEMFTLDDENFNIKPNWVVIMAGGMGVRLGHLTKDVPKPMLKVGNKPVIECIIDMFISHGFNKFMISVNYKAEVIKEYLKDGRDFGVEICYIEETKRLGTGGALSLITEKLQDPFIVTNGDVLSSFSYGNLLDYHNREQSIATMCIKKDSYQIPYGVVNVDEEGNIITIQEKLIKEFFINAGIYVLCPSVLDFIPKNEFYNLPELFELLNSKNKVVKTFQINGYWIDIGRPSDYEKVQRDHL
ncbi:nucleotidyltransferase family protein [bacterium]|nr:nucleotidyltransferase family protein [bacterium]